jgi:signal transduction histidine kinase
MIKDNILRDAMTVRASEFSSRILFAWAIGGIVWSVLGSPVISAIWLVAVFVTQIADRYITARYIAGRMNPSFALASSCGSTLVYISIAAAIWLSGTASGKVVAILVLTGSMIHVGLTTTRCPRLTAILMAPSTLLLLGLVIQGILVSASLTPVEGVAVATAFVGFITNFVKAYRVNSALHVALSNAQAQAQADRSIAIAANRAKSQFLANMSHELRTPLNAIIGYSEILKEDREAGNDETGARDAARITRAGKHLLTLINELLDISKIEAGKLDLVIAPVDVAAELTATSESIRLQSEANRNRFVLDLEPELGLAMGDSLRLRQVVLNLLSNATKFTTDGEVLLSARREETADSASIVVSVADSGIGMTEEQIARLFRPFEQAHPGIALEFGGTGLGLAISEKLMALMGGTIAVESAPGEGTTFTVRLPALEQEKRAA